ncbi:KAP family P-loop NTPase fold protein [Lactococcus carnosus]|uniref:KAP NTPase domain-containing protein n=1 Tax=Pseudolactococcus carnosus TaxID=2749961 RepID=A0ABT0AQZ1_9LACT|nr:P-loop NTPase fold protein [Lactococcus carnosus]MCJ1989044.1 hypothetical protein [Lactococcus carnosus]
MERQDINTAEDSQILKLLNKDLLNRNKNLYALINFINGIDGQMILNIDGAWGTGKSVFLRQLEYVSSTKDFIESQSSVYKTIVEEFKENYFVLYFNSWEHDLYNNPMESLISELLMKIASEIDLETEMGTVKDEMRGRLKKAGGKFLNRVINKITADLIDLEDFRELKEDNTPEITSIRSQKEAVNSLLQELSSITKKRILIIIDELDRCKPSYAVELLEIVKHFFTHDDVIFLFGTNKSELEHTIKSLYGQGFNGYKYLNRFFDFEFNLPRVDNEKYAESKHIKNQGEVVQGIITNCSKYFNFTMRDIDRFYSLFNTIQKDISYNENENQLFFYRIVMVYVTSLKIHNGVDFNNFIIGKGEEDFISFCKSIMGSIEDIYRSTSEESEIINKIKDIYSSLNNTEANYDTDVIVFKHKIELLTMLNN